MLSGQVARNVLALLSVMSSMQMTSKRAPLQHTESAIASHTCVAISLHKMNTLVTALWTSDAYV